MFGKKPLTAWWIVPFSFFLFTTLVRATDPPSAELTVILIGIRQEQEAYQKIAKVLGAQFVDTDVQIQLHLEEELPRELLDQRQFAAGIAHQTGAKAVMWLNLNTARQVHFYLKTNGGVWFMERQLDGTGEEGVAEALALISLSAVNALMQEGDPVESLGSKKKKPSSSPETDQTKQGTMAATPKSQSPPAKQGLVFPEAAYSLAMISTDRAPQNGCQLSIGFLIIRQLRVHAGYTFLQRLSDRNSFAELQLKRHPIHLGFSYRLPIDRWLLELGLALSLDYLKRFPNLRAEQGNVRHAYGKWTPILEPSVRGSFRIFKTLYLFGQLGAEVFLYQPDWTFTGGSDFFADLWIAQPRLLLGATIGLF